MRRIAATVVVFLVVVVGTNLAIGRTRAVWDLTAEGSASLSPTTERVLRDVDRRIQITAFFSRDAVGRVEAATLLSRYRKANRRITFRVVDPVLAPGEAQRLGVQGNGSAAVQAVSDPEEIEIAQYAIEIDLTSAIARLVRGIDATVCFTTGLGERDITDDTSAGVSRAAGLLRTNGYTVRTYDTLSASGGLEDCDAAIVAAPLSELQDEVAATLRDYLRGSGKAWLLADPTSDVDLTPVSRDWGIRFLSGVVLEGDEESHLPGDVTSPIIRRYAGDSPAVRGLGPTFFPRTMAVEVRDTKDPGLSATAIAITSRLGYLDREDVETFDADVDREGPVAVGAAADRSEVSAPGTSRARINRTRVLAWGDVDFITNEFIGDAANARLWVQGIDWLTQPEDLVTAVPTFPKVRELELTAARSRYLLLLTAGLIPLLFLIAGGFVWLIRRGR